MRMIHFPNWPEVLSASLLPGREKHSFEITIRWYLGFCRRGRAEVHVESARDFIACVKEQKHPNLRGCLKTVAAEVRRRIWRAK